MTAPHDLARLATVDERQHVFREALDGATPGTDLLFDFGRVDPAEYARGCEALMGVVTIPVGVVGPLTVQHRAYTEDAEGRLIEGAEASGRFFIPMATYEGGLNASLNRGIKAANRCGGVSTWVLASGMTRGSCYVFETTEQAVAFSRWMRAHVADLKAWLEDPANPFRDAELGGIPLLSRYARLQRLDTYVASNTCHVVFHYSTGDACGQNMTTRNTYMVHAHVVLPRFHAETGIAPAQFFLEGNTGGDKKSSHLYHVGGGHGRTVLASVILTDEALTSVLKCSAEDLLKLREIGSEGAALSGMIGMAVNPVNVIAAIFAATGQDLACAGTSSMALMSAAECPGGVQCTLRLPNLEVGTVGGGSALPHQQRWLDAMQCRGPDAASRLAQVVAAAALCLELSTAAAMAAAGSVSFYTAHLERGGMRRADRPAQVAPALLDRLRAGGSR